MSQRTAKLRRQLHKHVEKIRELKGRVHNENEQLAEYIGSTMRFGRRVAEHLTSVHPSILQIQGARLEPHEWAPMASIVRYVFDQAIRHGLIEKHESGGYYELTEVAREEAKADHIPASPAPD